MAPADPDSQAIQAYYEGYKTSTLNDHDVDDSDAGYVMAWLIDQEATFSSSQTISAPQLERYFRESRPVEYAKIMARDKIGNFGQTSFLSRIGIGLDSKSKAAVLHSEEFFGAAWNEILEHKVKGYNVGGGITQYNVTLFNLRSPKWDEIVRGPPAGYNVLKADTICQVLSIKQGGSGNAPVKKNVDMVLREVTMLKSLVKYTSCKSDQDDRKLDSAVKLFVVPRTFVAEGQAVDFNAWINQGGTDWTWWTNRAPQASYKSYEALGLVRKPGWHNAEWYIYEASDLVKDVAKAMRLGRVKVVALEGVKWSFWSLDQWVSFFKHCRQRAIQVAAEKGEMKESQVVLPDLKILFLLGFACAETIPELVKCHDGPFDDTIYLEVKHLFIYSDVVAERKSNNLPAPSVADLEQRGIDSISADNIISVDAAIGHPLKNCTYTSWLQKFSSTMKKVGTDQDAGRRDVHWPGTAV